MTKRPQTTRSPHLAFFAAQKACAAGGPLPDAAAAGCDVAVIVTQPGSKSQQNAQRQGFDLLYTRAVLVLRSSPAASPGLG
jgi:hypothetical protein